MWAARVRPPIGVRKPTLFRPPSEPNRNEPVRVFGLSNRVSVSARPNLIVALFFCVRKPLRHRHPSSGTPKFAQTRRHLTSLFVSLVVECDAREHGQHLTNTTFKTRRTLQTILRRWASNGKLPAKTESVPSRGSMCCHRRCKPRHLCGQESPLNPNKFVARTCHTNKAPTPQTKSYGQHNSPAAGILGVNHVTFNSIKPSTKRGLHSEKLT